jgi:branched-chain amino acid transport system permease protein
MDNAAAEIYTRQNGIIKVLKHNAGLVGIFIFLSALPFLIAIFAGQPIAEILTNQAGTSKFLQGLAIEVFILAVFALSYDLLLGITGLLSFGHAMFFAVGAYLTGIMIKSFGWSLFPTILLVMGAGVVQALLFGLVLPRVKGITFALVTLGMASVFHIVIQSRELGPFTGADVGLQGVITPAFINPSIERLRFYFVAMIFMFIAYLVFRRFVNSPTGRVCTAIRDNEERALMLGFNTFYYKLAALFLASIAAALAGALHTLYQPIVHPNVAGLGFTVAAVLMVLIGGVGTLSGALIGAGIFRIMSYSLERYVSENSTFLIGVVYVLIVLFLPYGIIGTWRLKSFQLKQGRDRLVRLLTGSAKSREEKV